MTKSPLTTVFLAALLISALASVGFCWAYIAGAMELRNLQAEVNTIQGRRNFVATLAKEAIEYSKRDPKIYPILESAGIDARSANSVTPNKPAAK
jgi:hypothetical protein